MNTASELVTHYAEQLEPCVPPYAESTRRHSLTCDSYRSAISQLPDPTREIGDALLTLQHQQDWRRIDLWLMAAIARPDPSYVPALCNLLMCRERYIQHEWIAELLGDIRDPRSISALTDTCNVDADLDPAQSLAYRCIDSLHQIGTPESLAAIRSLAQSPLDHVRDYAGQTEP